MDCLFHILKPTLCPDVEVVPWSVLGTQLQLAGRIVQKAPKPRTDIWFCDSAELPYIQDTGPGKARVASAAIY